MKPRRRPPPATIAAVALPVGETCECFPSGRQALLRAGDLYPDACVLVPSLHVREILERPASYVGVSRHSIRPGHVGLEAGLERGIAVGIPLDLVQVRERVELLLCVINQQCFDRQAARQVEALVGVVDDVGFDGDVLRVGPGWCVRVGLVP